MEGMITLVLKGSCKFLNDFGALRKLHPSKIAGKVALITETTVEGGVRELLSRVQQGPTSFLDTDFADVFRHHPAPTNE